MHSELPFGLCDDYDHGDISIVSGPDALTVAVVSVIDVGPELAKGNAQFLQLAANNHLALVEQLDDVAAALETVLAHYGGTMPPDDYRQRSQLAANALATIVRLRAALGPGPDFDAV